MFLKVLFPLWLCALSPLVQSSNLTQFNHNFSKSFKQELTQYNIPGGAYAIVENDKIVAIETFGHIDKKHAKAIDGNTVFRLASVSKSFAATVTTMLAQEQQLDLSDPITKYVPSFNLAKDGAAQRIQLKHILSHSAGLMPNAYDNLLHENWSIEKIISRFDRVKPICEPEKCYGYQNIAYAMLKPAIEASQSKSFSDLLNDRVFTPLNMTHASVGIDVFKNNSNTAKPHILIKKTNTGKKDKNGNKIKNYVWRTINVQPDYYKVPTAAGINASITDLAKWLIANLGYNPDTLSPALLTELTTPRIKTKKDLRRKFWRKHLTDAHYGYGWRIYQFEDAPIIYHSGWVSGFRADIGYSPKLGVGFAVLINAESNAINKISSEFWSGIHQLLHHDSNSKNKAPISTF